MSQLPPQPTQLPPHIQQAIEDWTIALQAYNMIHTQHITVAEATRRMNRIMGTNLSRQAFYKKIQSVEDQLALEKTQTEPAK